MYSDVLIKGRLLYRSLLGFVCVRMNFPGFPRARRRHKSARGSGHSRRRRRAEPGSKSTSPRMRRHRLGGGGEFGSACGWWHRRRSAATALVPADHFDPWRPRASSLTSPRSSAGKAPARATRMAVAHMIPLRAKFGRSTLRAEFRESLATDIQRRGECLSGRVLSGKEHCLHSGSNEHTVLLSDTALFTQPDIRQRMRHG